MISDFFFEKIIPNCKCMTNNVDSVRVLGLPNIQRKSYYDIEWITLYYISLTDSKPHKISKLELHEANFAPMHYTLT